MSVQQKEQEIAESRVENEREILRGKAKTDAERVQASVVRETLRQNLVTLQAENKKQEADTELVFGSISRDNPLNLDSLMPEGGVIFSGGVQNDFIAFDSGCSVEVGVPAKVGRLII